MTTTAGKVPGAVVVDTRDGYTWYRDAGNQPFTADSAQAFATVRNGELQPEHGSPYRVFALVPAGAPSQLQRMHDAADRDDEHDTLNDLARRAGILWECPPGSPDYCGWDNPEDAETCGGCGTPRRTCSCGTAWADEPGHDDDSGHETSAA